MEEVEELLDIRTEDIKAIVPKLISAAIVKVPRKKCVWAQFFRPNRDLVGAKTDKLEIPKVEGAANFVWGITPGTDITTQTQGTLEYTAITLSVQKAGGWVRIPREVLDQGVRDVVRDFLYEVGMDWKEELDDQAFEAMVDPTKVTNEKVTSTSATFSLANDMVMSIDSISFNGPTKVEAVDYAGGKVICDKEGTITVSYTHAANAVLGVNAGKGTVTAQALLLGRTKMLAEARTPQFAFIGDQDLP